MAGPAPEILIPERLPEFVASFSLAPMPEDRAQWLEQLLAVLERVVLFHGAQDRDWLYGVSDTRAGHLRQLRLVRFPLGPRRRPGLEFEETVEDTGWMRVDDEHWLLALEAIVCRTVGQLMDGAQIAGRVTSNP